MKFLREGWRTRGEDVRIEVTPLIDLMFQFLVFFLLTTTFITNAGLEVELPRAKSAQKQMEARDIVVGIDASGKVVYNQTIVSDTELAGILEEEYAKRPQVTVIVQADARVSHGRVVEVMDIIREAGFTHIAIATLAE